MKLVRLIALFILLALIVHPYHHASAAVVLSNFSSVLESSKTITNNDSGEVRFTIPPNQNFDINSIKIRLTCLETGDSCRTRLQLFRDDSGTLVSLGFSDFDISSAGAVDKVISLTFMSATFDAGKSYVIRVKLIDDNPNSSETWHTFGNAPSGIFTYNGSQFCPGGVCTPMGGHIAHFSVEIDAIPLTPPPPPTLIAPAHRAHTTDTTPTFTWSSVTGFTTYRIIIYLEDGTRIEQKVVTGTSFTPTTPLSAGIKYLWRVRTKDDITGQFGASSPRNTLFVD
jgi:hypothetical protein